MFRQKIFTKHSRRIFVKKIITLLLAALMLLSLAACSSKEEKSINLTYVEWAGEIAATNVAMVLLEEMGYEVEIQPVGAAAMWQAIGTGASDAMVSAWLPYTHGDYLDGVKDTVEELNPIMDGAKIGLVVPSYVEIDSVEELNDNADKFSGRIVGIDPGAGLMAAAEEALTAYGLDNIELVEGSDSIMTAVLDDEINRGNWVVVTGWAPHWKFARYDLKFLDDPKGVFGGEEYVAAIVREGLKEDMPDAYEFLNNFYWTPEQLAEILVWNEEPNADPYETAKRWVNENRDIVDKWKPGA